MKSTKTKEILLDTAERLFAEKGIKETSVRDITGSAGVHLAAINYHFGSKDELIREVIARRIKPLNEKRLEKLHGHRHATGYKPVALENILEALFAPSIELTFENPHFRHVAGQVVSHPEREIYRNFVAHFEEVFSKFKEAMGDALPHLPEEELMWRIHFLMGAMIHTWTNHKGLEHLSMGVCKLEDESDLTKRLVTFCAAGLRAPTKGSP